MLDRIGKGIRTAPRDALISLTHAQGEARRRVRRAPRARHHRRDDRPARWRSAILAVAPFAFDAVFTGLALLRASSGSACSCCWCRKRRGRRRPRRAAAVAAPRARPAAAAALPRARRSSRRCSALATISDAFVYLAAAAPLDFDAALLPAAVRRLRAGLHAARGARRAARRPHRPRHGLPRRLRAAARRLRVAAPARHRARPMLGLVLVLLGAYYAATDGVLTALARRARCPRTLRGSGLAPARTATTLARLVGSMAFGALWTWRGPRTPRRGVRVALVVAMAVGAVGSRLVDAACRRTALAIFAVAAARVCAIAASRCVLPRASAAASRRARPARRTSPRPRRPTPPRRRQRRRRSRRRTLVFRSLDRATGRRTARAGLAPLGDPEHRAGRPACAASASTSPPRGRHLPRVERLAAGTCDAKLLGPGPAACGTRAARRRAEPRAGLARRPLRRDHGVRRPATPTPTPGAFSTQTLIIDMATGKSIANLEQFKVDEDGKRVDAAGRQLLGRHLRARTATASTRRSRRAARRYLIEGSVSGTHGARDPRERRVPVAVARRHADRATRSSIRTARRHWRLHVLDLRDR